MKFSFTRASRSGYGLVEVILTVALTLILASFVVQAARDALTAQRGRSSSDTIRIIESAKRLFVSDNPGVNLTNVSQLLPYLPGGVVPAGVHPSEVFSNVSNLNAVTVSSVNGLTNYEPLSTNFGAASNNGFNDLGNAMIVEAPSVAMITPSAVPGETTPDSTNLFLPFSVKYVVTITSGTGGTIAPAGVYPIYVDQGSTITATATPTSGGASQSTFSLWSNVLSGGTFSSQNPVTFTVNTNVSIEAIFIQQWNLTTAVNPSGVGSISPATGFYNSVVSISASPNDPSAYQFAGFTTDGTFVSSSNSNTSADLTSTNHSVTANFIHIPAVPTGLSLLSTNTALNATWTPVSPGAGDSITYNIYVNGTIAQSGISGTTYSIGSLINGTAYSVAISATETASGLGTTSSALSAPVVGVPYTIPSVPLNFTDAPADQELDATWSAPNTNGGTPITSYVITVNGATNGVVDTVSFYDAITNSGASPLVDGTSYTIGVAASNAAGVGPYATLSDIPLFTPGAPTALVITPTNAQLGLTWAAPTNNGGDPITGYLVDYSGGGQFNEISVSTTNATISGLSNGVSYNVIVTAVNDVGNGGQVAGNGTPYTLPDAPQNLVFTPNGNGSGLGLTPSWSAPDTNGGSPITSYLVYPTNTGTPVVVASGLTTYLSSFPLNNPSALSVAVAASNAAGIGPAITNSFTGVLPPAAPTGLVLAAGNAVINSSWTASVTNNPSYGAPLGYIVSLNGSSNQTVASTNASISGLVNFTSYGVGVKAYNIGGTSASITGNATPIILPNTPQSLVVTPTNTALITTWAPPVSNGAVLSGYVATLSSGGSLVASNQVSSVTTNITFSGLTNGQSYAVSVFSYVNNDMVGGAGGIAGPVTGVPGTVPSVPTSYSVNPSSQTLSLTWGAPTNNGGYSITSYVISQNGSVVQTTSSAPASITGLSNGTTYTVSVAASNFFGVGPSVSSNAVPALGHPSAPINVVLAPTNTAIGVSWGPPTNNGGTAITSYQVLVNGSNGPTSATTNANVTGLTNGVSYAISVEASNSVGFGTPSAVQYGIPFTVPSVPTAFIATGTNTGLHLTWGAPTNNGGNAVTGYDVYLAGAFNQHVTNLAASLTNLVNGSTYAVSVAASNAAGDGALVSSNAIPCTVPGAVTGLQFPDLSTKTATNILLGVTFPATSSYGGGADGTSSTNAPYVNNNSYLYVTWGNPATNGGSAITGYAVYNGTNLAYTTNASTLWGGLGGMANGTTNSVGVAAVNVAGTGPITTLWGIPSTVPPDINNQSGWNVGLEYGSVSAGSNSITISGVIDGGNGGAPIDYYIGYTMSPSVYAGVTNYSYVMNYYTPAGEVIPLIGSQEGGIFISQPGDTNQHRYMGDIVLKATNGQKNYVFLAPHNINGFGGTLDPTLNQYIGTCLGLYTPAATWAVTTSSTNTSRANTNIGITSSVGSSWTSGTANGSPLLVFNISPLIDSNGFDAAEFTGFTPYNVTGRSLSLSHMFVSSYMGGTYCGTGPGTYTYSVQASETVSSGATYTGYGTGTVTLTDVAPTTTLFPANGVATNYTIVSPINLCAEVYEPDYFYRMSATSYAVLNGQTSSVVNCGGPTKTGVYNASNSSYYVFYNAFTNIPPGEYTAIAYSTGPFGSTDTATLAINVIRNLVIYYNAGDALITNVYTLNLAGVGDTNMSNFLTGLNQTQLSNAITIAASTVATNASFAATNATTSVLYSQSTNAATNTYEAYSGVIAIGQENQGADMISAANAHLANIDWSNTNYYDTADVSNLLNDSLSPSNLGMAGHTGNWSMGFYRMVTNTTVTRTDVYQHHTLGTFSTSYSAGKFVVIDADTGLILGDVSSTGPNSFSSLSYGLPINFYGDTGWTNLTSMTGPLNFAGQITGLVLGSTGVATNAGAVTTYSINYTTLSNTTNYTPWYEASQWSPITIDLSGSPDFLADQWRAVPHPPNWMAMRKYNLDGTGEKLWEWVGPTEGILIWNPTGDPHLVPSAANMFSLSFQGKHFANGFDAISSLDESGSHILKGKILNSIWVWVDANGNGKIDKGELKPLTSLGIKWLDISHSTDNQGGLFNDHGAETDGNKSYPLRDWWSQGGIAPAEADSFLQDCLKGPPIYLWTPDNGYENPLATKSPFQDKVVPFLNCPLGGYFRFDAIGDSISVLMDRVFADTGKHVKALTTKLTVIDGLFAWDVPIGDSSVLKTRFVLSKDLTKLYGVTEVSERGVPKGQFTWTADHVSGPLLTDLLFAFTRLQKKH